MRAGAPLAARLAAAGAAGVGGAVTLTILFGRSSHSPLHLVSCGAIWAGGLVVCISLALLRVRTTSLDLGRAASLAIVGLVLTAAAAYAAAGPLFSGWWGEGPAGAMTRAAAGELGSVFCFGLCAAGAVGMIASVLVILLGGTLRGAWLSASFLSLLLAPALLLEISGHSTWSLLFGAAGTVGGAYLGVRVTIAAAEWLRRAR